MMRMSYEELDNTHLQGFNDSAVISMVEWGD